MYFLSLQETIIEEEKQKQKSQYLFNSIAEMQKDLDNLKSKNDIKEIFKKYLNYVDMRSRGKFN